MLMWRKRKLCFLLLPISLMVTIFMHNKSGENLALPLKNNFKSTFLQTHRPDTNRKTFTAPTTQPNNSTASEDSPPILVCNNRPIVYLKAYKVGGTTISGMLSAHILSSSKRHRKLIGLLYLPTPHWCNSVAGTEHAFLGVGQKLMERSDSKLGDPKPLYVLGVRNPHERLWSAYHHAMERLDYHGNLIQFLRSQTPEHHINRPPHLFLALDTQQAMKLIENRDDILILDFDRLDESVALLSKLTGSKMCQFLFSSCQEFIDTETNWNAHKCRRKALPKIDRTSLSFVRMHADTTGETVFYDKAIEKFDQMMVQYSITNATIEFRKLRQDALAACHENYNKLVISTHAHLDMHPDVARVWNKVDGFRLVLEPVHPIDVLGLCMQRWACGLTNTTSKPSLDG